MGVENIEKISRELIANGRSADCPAAVIRWGTHPEQRTLITTLGKAAADVKATGMKPPAIFLVGEVVRLREQLQWFDNKPLFGKTVIVTRARAQASALTKSWKHRVPRLSKLRQSKSFRQQITLRWTTLLPISMTTNGLSSPALTA